jgi:type VI secretion system protein ImpL
MVAIALFVLLAVVAWPVALVLGWPLWVPALLTLVFGLLSLPFVWRVLHGRKKQSAVSQALVGKAKPPEDAASAQLKREFESMRSALMRSQLRGGGQRAIDALPWFLVIGPRASGKTSAIRASGLAFSQLGDATSRGSSTCDYWLANEGVFFDTSGLLEEHAATWSLFLELLKRTRTRPLHGIVVTIDVGLLLEEGEAWRAHVESLRPRILEAISQVRTQVPITVLVTQCDLLPGFAETFAELSAEEREQAWGFTLPFEASHETARDVMTRCATHMRTMVDALTSRSALLLHDRSAQESAAIAHFPEVFDALRDPLAGFLAELVLPDALCERALLRGAYFTSATQPGHTIDLAQRAFQERMRVSPSEATWPATEVGMFLLGVLRDRLVIDAQREAPTEMRAASRRRLQRGLGITLAITGSLLVLGSVMSWRRNRAFLSGTIDAMAPLSEQGTLAPSELTPLRTKVVTLRRHQRSGIPIAMRFGLYRGDSIQAPVTMTYGEGLRDRVMRPVAEEQERAFEAFLAPLEAHPDRTPTPEQTLVEYARLVRYLRVTGPRASTEPHVLARERQNLARTLSSAAREGERDALRDHASVYFVLIEEHPELAVPRRETLVQRMRQMLTRTSRVDATIDAIAARTEGRDMDITLARLIGSLGTTWTSEGQVRGAYTRRGWDEIVRAAIDERAAEEAREGWVLGDAAVSAESLRAALRTRYFHRYAEAWQHFLRGVRLRPPSDQAESLRTLEDLTRGDPAPMSRLFRGLAHHFELHEAMPSNEPENQVRAFVSRQLGEASEADSGPARVTDPSLDSLRRFLAFGVAAPTESGDAAPVGLDIYEEQLAFVRDALVTAQDDPSTSDALAARLQAARVRIQGLVAEQDVGVRPLLHALLWPPVEGASMASSREAAAAMGRSWCHAIVSPFHDTLLGRYPFDREGEDAAVADFAAFYGRDQGTLWSYYAGTLSSRVERDGDHFVLVATLGDAGRAYRSTLPLFLERSQAITGAFFPVGATEPQVELDIRIHPVEGASQVHFNVGGTAIDYRNGPEEWSRIVWPGTSPQEGATLEVRGQNGLEERIEQPGEWGLFRLLERAARVAGGGHAARRFVVTWRMPRSELEVQVDVQPVRAESPFFASDDRQGRVLGPLRNAGVLPPREIASSGSGACSE